MTLLEEMANKWSEHLNENNMTYYEHFKFAAYGALVIGVHCLRLLIHSVLPCFNRKALFDIHQTAIVRRNISQLNKTENLFRSLAAEEVFKCLDELESNREHTCNRKCGRRS